ncbi:MAG: hypothetical protein M3360_05220 [Actinomycetota bacterium]|nr:hypothetical protein [Actinomycetota bacterium]
MLAGFARIVIVAAAMIEHEMLLELRAGREAELAFRALEDVVHTRLLGL